MVIDTRPGLSRRRLVEAVALGVGSLGYGRVAGPVSGALAVFYKRVDQLILTLGLEASAHYEARFTGSFYLSRSFEWAYVVRGFPTAAYRRIGHFLTADERAEMLEPEFCEVGVVDAWWTGFTPERVSVFVRAVELAEPRFRAQSGLREAVLECEGLRRHRQMLDEVVHLVETGSAPEGGIFQPKQFPKDVPRDWFYGAELVLRRHRPESVNPKYVSLLALDAWRVAVHGR